MMTRLFSTSVLVFALSAPPALAQLHATLVASGFIEPIAIVAVPGMARTFLVAEQTGHIKVLQNGAVLPNDFLDLSSPTQIVSGGEQGLLGLALAPDYQVTGRFWVNFTDPAGNTVVARFVRSASNQFVADPASRFDLVWPDGHAYILQPFVNHNGGNLLFGPDGYLYIGMGDGGSGNDPNHNAQNPMSLLGKMLRIDVNVPTSDPQGYDVPPTNPFVNVSGYLGEIWDVGMRNPWRWSFDEMALGGTGALVIGDVGQDHWEEVDYEPLGHGGRNYGWRNREGAHDNDTSRPPAFTPLVDPIFEYSHAEGNVITGGVVYRGAVLGSAYVGRYFFADFGAGRVWSIALTINPVTHEATASNLMEHTNELGVAANLVSSFGTDPSGEMYVLNYFAGTVNRIDGTGTPLPSPGTCSTPDPFAALGGGTCANGGWFPPGYPIPGATPASPSTPPPPVSSPGTCGTPDPFVALGGGTCANGDWFPPGYPIPGVTPVSPPTPPPLVPPVSSPSTCSTPDPFAALGGGTCANGNWFPPGYPIPSGTPASTPTPPPIGGCIGPDPFIGIPGLHGVCINGGWFPVGGRP
jgi:glucose/arabinose dehydrogenase